MSSPEVVKSLEDEHCFSEQKGQTTCGEFADEKSAHDFFISFFAECPYFKFEHEVTGRRLFDSLPVKPNADVQSLRIDGILHPTGELFHAGWMHGPIGIEIKKTGIALGGVVAQIMEQRTTLFRSPYLNYTRLMPTIFSVFPSRGITHDLHSLFETQSILCCFFDKWSKSMKFGLPSKNVMSISRGPEWKLHIDKKWLPSSTKGHRGLQK